MNQLLFESLIQRRQLINLLYQDRNHGDSKKPIFQRIEVVLGPS